MTRNGIAARAGRWSAHHRGKAIGGWLAFIAIALVIAGGTGTKKLSTTETLDGQAAAASRTLDRAGFDRPAAEQVLVQSRTGRSVLGPDGRAAIHDVIVALRSTGRVLDVRSPLVAGNEQQVTREGRSAIVMFNVRGEASTAEKRVQPVLEAVRRVARSHGQLRIEEFGAASANRALQDTLGKDFRRAEAISIPLTFAILIVAFGALLAAVVPLGLALTAVAAGGGLLALASHALHVDGSSSTVLLLIGLAVGVDYSLFYIRRAGEERARGAAPRGAIEAAAATSGRSVLISGLTVIIAMAGMFITGQGTFMGMAEATVLVVGAAMLGSLTVLPATLSLLGDRIDRGRIPWLGTRLLERRERGPSRFWSALLRRVLARPRASAAVAGGFLVIVATPALFLHTGLLSPSQDLPSSLPVMKTYTRLQHAFPGGAAPAQLVVSAPDVTAPTVVTQLHSLRRRALASGQMFAPITEDVNPDRTVAVINVPLAGDGQDAASRAALSTLRHKLVPLTVGKVAAANVTGSTAASVDFNSRLKQRAQLVVLFVLGLAFLLLRASFRSPVIAATGLVLNLLSVSAAYGVVVAVFQWGWGKHILGLSSTGTISAWLPLFLFVILFGLSMDYHVFSVSRIKEEHDAGATTHDAIRTGIARSAGVITSAAIIMVFVFLTFATLSQTSMKQLGVGLAAAVLLDATVVRAILLPSVMAVLGERNWSRRRARSHSAPVGRPATAHRS
jgi:uncharacterized membrane protein YdfJ with MMPL/SSD domain